MKDHYDYIVVGAGGAGLSLIMRILDEPALSTKSILLIDRSPKTTNDRTWCFWEKGEGYFEEIIHHQWERLFVRHPLGDMELKANGYVYKMLRGIDFYEFCFSRINKAGSRMQVLYGEVTEMDPHKGKVSVDGINYSGEFIFSSVLSRAPQISPREFYLLQHFRGWWIETNTDFFDPNMADLMNFRVSQDQGCSFAYVMPVSPKRALIEYTVFSEKELSPNQYDDGIKQFITKELKLNTYSITETEQGIIPMTNFHFTEKEGKVIYIGTAGGQTKATTGYTFTNMQKHAVKIVQGLLQNKPGLLVNPASKKYRVYDSILLRVLKEQKMDGSRIFYGIFKRNPAGRVFRFLDNESSAAEDFAIMLSTPPHIFVPAFLKEIS